MTAEELRELARGARCRITDGDFDQAEMTPAEEETLLGEMAELGYEIGLDEDQRNEWWPPDKDCEVKDERQAT